MMFDAAAFSVPDFGALSNSSFFGNLVARKCLLVTKRRCRLQHCADPLCPLYHEGDIGREQALADLLELLYFGDIRSRGWMTRSEFP